MRLTRKAKLSSQTFAFEIDLWTEVVHKDQTQAFCRHGNFCLTHPQILDFLDGKTVEDVCAWGGVHAKVLYLR